MCGIAGLVDLRRRLVAEADIEAMTTTLRHRGPDGQGVERPVPWVGLGHRRLSIIDLAGGHQPLANEDGSIWITCNGEIFNYRELRHDLRRRGHRFRTQTDTEVILHLYEERGSRCVDALNGQFAFAIFDGERLFCARDPLGVKPFHYAVQDGRFAFASELRAIVALPGFAPRLDLDALRLYLEYRYIPAPACALKDCAKLRAGEWLILDGKGRIRRRRYWNPAGHVTAPPAGDASACLELLLPRLEESVGRQLVSDVPVGAFLSGGLDSSSIVALTAGVKVVVASGHVVTPPRWRLRLRSARG